MMGSLEVNSDKKKQHQNIKKYIKTWKNVISLWSTAFQLRKTAGLLITETHSIQAQHQQNTNKLDTSLNVALIILSSTLFENKFIQLPAAFWT